MPPLLYFNYSKMLKSTKLLKVLPKNIVLCNPSPYYILCRLIVVVDNFIILSKIFSWHTWWNIINFEIIRAISLNDEIVHCVKSVQIRSFFWSVFSCIRTEYRKIRTGKNSVFGHFLRSEFSLWNNSHFIT